jgi:drug/metabolite transporter (DMT)-like permease
VPASRSNLFIVLSLVFAVFLWGGNNAGSKYLIAGEASWPPMWTGGTRFFCAGLLLLAITRWTRWLGVGHGLTPELRRSLWWHAGLSLALYILAFNWALRFTSVSHVALYLGAAPVWTLLWEGRPTSRLVGAQRYAAALLALTGVFTLFWPALKDSHFNYLGELLGISCSVLWANYGRQCRTLAGQLSGAEISAHTMWRAGAMLLPFGCVEIFSRGFRPTPWEAGIQLYCIMAGGVMAFAIWAMALKRWPTSKVYLFNNLIPLSTMGWAHFTLGEAVTPTFWVAMALIAAGVLLGQWRWSPAKQDEVKG